MRPILKTHPLDADKKPMTFKHYRHAKPELLRQLGEFCSYCEIELKDGHEVEHVQPKSLAPELENEWDNFLLGCKRCNARKGAEPIDLDDYLWPDRDNTLRAIDYHPDNSVSVAAGLEEPNRSRAVALMILVGLDHQPDELFEDPRFDHRLDAWQKALEAKQDVWRARNEDKAKTRAAAIKLAKLTGYFSVWMTVFNQDSAMRLLLIEAFDGTAPDCFDESGKPQQRRGGKV